MRPDVPQQINGYDCDVYCLIFAHILYRQLNSYCLSYDNNTLKLRITLLLQEVYYVVIEKVQIDFREALHLLIK